MVARMQHYKGATDLLTAIARRPRPIAQRLLVIGPDEPLEPGVRADLHRMVDALGLASIVGISQPLSDDDLAAVMADADVLVHPSHQETFGLVLVEALTLGTPVVAYAAPGPSSILTNGGGTLVPVGDIAGLARVLADVASTPDRLEQWRTETGDVANRFSHTAMVDEYEQAFVDAHRSAVDG